jgi:hypothetical protein
LWNNLIKLAELCMWHTAVTSLCNLMLSVWQQ